MKKKIILMVAILLIFSTVGSLAAFGRASDYLRSYGVELTSTQTGKIKVTMETYGTEVMDKLGANYIKIEYQVGSTWYRYDTYYGSDNESLFYSTNVTDHVKDFTIDGISGMKFRATMEAYAAKGTGSDTGIAKSFEITCK